MNDAMLIRKATKVFEGLFRLTQPYKTDLKDDVYDLFINSVSGHVSFNVDLLTHLARLDIQSVT
jgi:hypothetical protein